MMNSSFDVAIIGSSPVLMIEAICQSYQNKRVVIIERRSRLGGAWYTKKLWDSVTVEVGCHYIERSSDTYSFITNVFGIELEKEPRHLVWHNTSITGEDIGNSLSPDTTYMRKLRSASQKIVTGRLFSRNLWNVLLAFKHRDVAATVQGAKDYMTARPYLYPTGGFQILLKALERQIQSAGITLMLDTAVQAIEVQADTLAKLTLATGQSIRAAKVTAGQQADVDIDIDGQPLEIPRQRNRNIHIIYHICGEKNLCVWLFGYCQKWVSTSRVGYN